MHVLNNDRLCLRSYTTHPLSDRLSSNIPLSMNAWSLRYRTTSYFISIRAVAKLTVHHHCASAIHRFNRIAQPRTWKNFTQKRVFNTRRTSLKIPVLSHCGKLHRNLKECLTEARKSLTWNECNPTFNRTIGSANTMPQVLNDKRRFW